MAKVGSKLRWCALALVGLVIAYEVGFIAYIRHPNLWDDTGTRPFNWIYAPRMAMKLYPIKYGRHEEEGGFSEVAYWIGGGDIRVDNLWPNGQLMSRVRKNFDGREINGDYFDETGQQISKLRNGTGMSYWTDRKSILERDYENYRTVIYRIWNGDHSPRISLWQQYKGDKHVGVLCLVDRGRRLPEPMRREDAEKLDLSVLPAAVAGDMYAPGDPRSTWKLSETNAPSAN